VVTVGIFLYAVFSIFPNDILATALGLVRYDYAKAIIPLLIGNMTFYSILAWVVAEGLQLFG